MTIIAGIRTFFQAYEHIEDGHLVKIDHVADQPIDYALIPLAGARIISYDIIGNTIREYQFAFQTAMSTAADLERLENAEFFEGVAAWLEEQTNAGTFPDIGSGKSPTIIEATNWGYLYEEGQSDTGMYQINCKLTYDQEA